LGSKRGSLRAARSPADRGPGPRVRAAEMGVGEESESKREGS